MRARWQSMLALVTSGPSFIGGTVPIRTEAAEVRGKEI